MADEPKYVNRSNLERMYDNIKQREVQTFDTVAAMQAATHLEAGMTCQTNGFHAAGDGGAAYYTVSTTGTANGMDVLALQGGLFATLVATKPYVTPEQFGAWGDGTHDDTDVFVRIIALELPMLCNKSYSVSSFRATRANIDGRGTITCATPIVLGTATHMRGITVVGGLYYDSGANATNTTIVDWLLEDVAIEISDATAYGIHISLLNGKGLIGATFNRVSFTGTGAACFHVSTRQNASSRPWFAGFDFNQCGTYDTYAQFFTCAEKDNTTYSDSFFSANFSDCYFQWTSSAEHFMTIRDFKRVHIANCKIYDASGNSLFHFLNENSTVWIDGYPSEYTLDTVCDGADGVAYIKNVNAITNVNGYNFIKYAAPFGFTNEDANGNPIKMGSPLVYPYGDKSTGYKGIYVPQIDGIDTSGTSRGEFMLVIDRANGLWYRYRASNGNWTTSQVYHTQNMPKGTTSARPTTPIPTGYMYYDTTLSKPIWWNGSAWKDATGATV